MTEQELKISMESYGVPEHLHGGLIRYFINGIEPGSFLNACLINDFARAVCKYDDDSPVSELAAIARWLFNEAPSLLWGSPEAVLKWIAFKKKERLTA